MATVVVVAALIPELVASAGSRTVLEASAARYARPSNLVRSARSSESVEFELYLGLADLRGAEASLASVSDPDSPEYGDYLTPSEFRARFARTRAEVEEVRSWLESHGFHVGHGPANRTTIPARGSVREVERAFGVRMNYYRSNGELLRAPSGAPSIPDSIAGVVRGVLDLAEVRMDHGLPPPPASFRVGRPCSAYWGQLIATKQPAAYGQVQPLAVCGYEPDQMQGAYGIDESIAAGVDGSGVTVAVVDAYASPTIQADLDEYSDRHDLPQLTVKEVTRPPERGRICDQTGWWGEETLDIEAVHSMAPGAKVLYWGASSCFDRHLREAVGNIIDRDRADIITNSWGGRDEQSPESIIQAWHDLFVQAGNQGIGVYFSSGDEGDNIQIRGFRSVIHPASDPAVTAVGGTSLGVDATNEHIFETGWGTGISLLRRDEWRPEPPGDFLYGGGGGTSRIFAQPNYQAGVVPESLSGYWGGANRVVPDVATDGDPNTGFLVGQTQTFLNGDVKYGEYRIGGTSLSSPLFAGIMAVADDAADMQHGFVNPLLYSLEGSDALRDIIDPTTTIAVVRPDFLNGENRLDGVAYSLRTMNQTGTLHTRTGYDDVTGVGTPKGQDFLDAVS